ncbi:MAG: substrate-binding domain-containing protein [Acidobacteriia bacterium]|nr:substrate-binding domain-containing protein [Terriglobia bacterium]
MYSRLIALAFTGLGLASAQTTSVRVLGSNGVRAVIEELKPQYEQKTGRRLEIQWGSTTDQVKKINSGESFDLTILTTEAIDQLAKAGKLMPKTAPVARCGVGVGIRSGSSKPDIATPEAMKRTLLQAKSITYAEDGASRAYVEKMMDHFGITAQMKPKIMLAHGSVAADALVADGKAEMVLTLASEILPAPGVTLVGTLPEQVQGYINFAAGISANAKNADAAEAFINVIKSSAAKPVYQAKGMEPR